MPEVLESPVPYQVEGNTIQALEYRPAEEGLCPGLIPLHAASGLTSSLADIARPRAGEGYLTLTPDLSTVTLPGGLVKSRSTKEGDSL